MGRDRPADGPAGTQAFRAAKFRDRIRMDLPRPPAWRCLDRISRGRGPEDLRRLPAGFHELGPPLPGGGGPRASDRAPEAGPSGRRAGNAHRGRASRLLLSLLRRLPIAGLAVAAALMPQIAFAHAQLIQSSPPPTAIMAALTPGGEG